MPVSIKQSDVVFPKGIDNRRDCPKHIREAKQEAYNVFKNISGEVTAPVADLNKLEGVIQYTKDLNPLSATKSNAIYTITPDPAYTSLIDGMRFLIQPDLTNDANPKLKINSITPREIVKNNGSSVSASDFTAGGYIEVVYDINNDHFKIIKQ